MAQAKCEIECLVKNRQRMFQSVLGFGINLRLNRLYIGYDINVNTLDKIIRKKSYTPDMAFIRLTSQQLMEGLYHLERIGIIHKDIKPENIYVKPNREQILIGNFHYCTYLQEPQNLVYNDKSLNYRAIEAFIEPEKVSHSVDVWSAGCVINEMLNFGRLLFEGKTPLAIIGSIYEIIGAPTRENCEGYDEIPFYKYIHFASSSDSFKPNFNMDNFHQYLNDFFERIFTHSISDRLSAKEALFHPFLKDLATEGLKKSEKWRKDYDALSDHSLKFEAQIRYVNALVEKIKEQKDRQNLDIKNKDMCKIITPKQLKRKRKLQKNNKSNPLLKELAKKPKLEPDDIKKISHLIEPTKKVSLEEKINFYKKQDVRKIFRSNTLFRRILFKTGKIELPLAYEILAKIEYGKMKLSDVKSGKVMKRKMVNLETRLKLKREKRLNKIKEIIKKRVEIKEKRICQALKRNLKNQPLPATVVKDKLIKESETTPPKKPINPESFMPPVFLNVEKKPEFAVPRIPEKITVKKQKSIENIVKEKKNIVEERKTKIKLLEISELPAEPIKVKKNEKPKHQEKSSILNHKITKPDKPFPQCLMPDDEPCSSKSIVKAKDKPWYEIKTVPELPFDKAPKIYIPPDNILMKPPYPTSQKNSRKSSHKSLTQKTSSVKPLKIPSVTTPAQRIQKLKAQTPLFSPPNDLPTSKPSPTVGRLYNQLTTKSPAVKTNDLQFDLKKFHNNRLEIDLNKDKLIKEKSYELLTEPPKPPTLPKKQPRTSETKNTIRNLLTIEKVKLQKKGGRNK
uniref:Protein kinase domain-containing protein n=1 Tax=Parastrongyloides trichosuri TaxID=131310 RepID=A0A0N4ZSH1_PARTI